MPASYRSLENALGESECNDVFRAISNGKAECSYASMLSIDWFNS